MKKYLALIVVIICCLFIWNISFWSSTCDIRRSIDKKYYNDCINRERYNEAIDNYNNALRREDYVQALSYLDRMKRYGSALWVSLSDINNRIQSHSSYLCSAYAEKWDYNTALTYCKKSLSIFEDASVLYNAWVICSNLEYWNDALNYLNRAKKKSLDSSLNLKINNMIEYVNWEKEYADLKKTWRTNDKYWYYQYYMQKINIFDAWDKLPVNKKWVVIAVIDDWININHPDFKDKIWVNRWEKPGNWIDDDKNWYVDDYNWWDFVNKTNNTKPSWTHGTAVAWVIAAETDNVIWIAWIVPEVKIMSLNVFPTNWNANDLNIIAAINYAIDKWADIINLSLWGTQFTYTNNFDSVFKKANEKWIIIVVAAWNWDVLSQQAWVNTTVNKISPLCNESNSKVVIWVWALAKNWSQAKRSNYWSCVDFYMYWENIYSTAINPIWEPYTRADGTSLSAPILAGIIWLWYNKYWKLKPEIVYDNLKKSINWNVIDAAKYLDNLSLSQWELWKAISWMINKKFTKAKNATEFWWSNWITRAEAAKFFVTFANLYNKNMIVKSEKECSFSDINNAPSDLRQDIITACRFGFIGGSNWKFMPNTKLTNAQAVTVFMRMYSWKKDESGKHYADKYFVEAYRLGLIDWTVMWNQKNYEKWAKRWDVAVLLYRWAKIMKQQTNKNN